MTTITAEQAEMERGISGIDCEKCPYNFPGSLMWRFTSLDATINGESPS